LRLTIADDEVRVRAERARRIALWRYQLIREPADPGHSTRQRSRMVRELAGREHPGPFGPPVRATRATLDRWIAAWRRGGFDALVPSPRQATPRIPAEILDLAAALKRENPGRTAAQVSRILHKHLGWAPSESTVLRHLNRLELTGVPAAPVVFGRFEAERGIRMLTNHDLDRWSPFACLLVGQPTLRRRIKLGVLAALDQRIGLRYAMQPQATQMAAVEQHRADLPSTRASR
jgi:hypothetical protein